MLRLAAGLLLFRRLEARRVQVLLVHPGGPLWADRDLDSWSIPKGEPIPGEDLLWAARREFREETGASPEGEPFFLGQITQKGGKAVHAWALEGQFDPAALKSNTFQMEWPRGSGQWQTFPEVDRAEWFSLTEARRRVKAAQSPLIDALQGALAAFE